MQSGPHQVHPHLRGNRPADQDDDRRGASDERRPTAPGARAGREVPGEPDVGPRGPARAGEPGAGGDSTGGGHVHSRSVGGPAHRAAGPGHGVAARVPGRASLSRRDDSSSPPSRAWPPGGRPRTRSRRWSVSSRSKGGKSRPAGQGFVQDAHFHAAIGRAAHNQAITRIAARGDGSAHPEPGGIAEHAGTSRALAPGSPARSSRAIAQRQVATAEEAMRNHLVAVEALVLGGEASARRSADVAAGKTLTRRRGGTRIVSAMADVDFARAGAGTDYPGAAGPARSTGELDDAGCYGQEQARGARIGSRATGSARGPYFLRVGRRRPMHCVRRRAPRADREEDDVESAGSVDTRCAPIR